MPVTSSRKIVCQLLSVKTEGKKYMEYLNFFAYLLPLEPIVTVSHPRCSCAMWPSSKGQAGRPGALVGEACKSSCAACRKRSQAVEKNAYMGEVQGESLASQ